IVNNALFQDQNQFNNIISNDLSGATSSFTNNSLYSKTGAGVTTIGGGPFGITLDNTANVQIQAGSLFIGTALNNTGLVEIQGGTLTASPGSLNNMTGGTIQLQSGALNVLTNGTLDNMGTVEVLADTADLDGNVVQYVGDELTGGTWIVRGSGAIELRTDDMFAQDIVTSAGDITLDGPNSSFERINTLTTNNGAFRLINRGFTAVASFSGAGTLQLEAATFTAPDLTIDSGGDLIGNGTVISTTLINGTVAPGPNVDELVFDGNLSFDGGTYDWDVESLTVFDLITVQGDTDFTASTINVNLIGFQPQIDDTFDILTADSITGVGELTVTVGGLPSNIFEASIVDIDSIQALRLTAVPIPSALALFIVPLLGMFGVARRRAATKD
ncbi:MAG: hypothetical protein QNJ73_15145, partial [Gammaproteobacteria bacterium]|nr:hypothetical protein [Gammaproteobacteria bacterium]